MENNYQSSQIYLYIEYLTHHIARVREAMRRFINSDYYKNQVFKMFVPVGMKIDTTQELLARADAHDRSKWQVDEFFPYMYHFYPLDGIVPEEGKDPDFDKAVEEHYRRNDHHDRYWRIEGRDINQMTFGAICEMLADWVSMSVYSQRSPLIWYNENKDEVLEGMAPQKRDLVDHLLKDAFEPIYQELQEEVNKKC